MDDMKQKTITTDKATLLVVELPEGAKPHNSYCDAILYTLPDGYVETEYPVESDGSWEWQLLGRLPDITEGQAERIADKHKSTFGVPLSTHLEALSSLLQANEVFFENKYGDERPPNLPVDADPYTSKKGYIKFRAERKHLPPSDLMVSYEAYCMAWQEAQSKVFDKERTYLFIKVD